jgi:hypothetical protein
VACKPSVFRVEKVECPIEVPPEIIAAYFGCGWDKVNHEAVCNAVSYVAPSLILDACDLVNVDGGVCDE